MSAAGHVRALGSVQFLPIGGEHNMPVAGLCKSLGRKLQTVVVLPGLEVVVEEVGIQPRLEQSAQPHCSKTASSHNLH